MKKNIISLAALLIASATFVACSSDDNIIDNNIDEQPVKGQTYTMTINASKGGDAQTRALSLDGKTLNASWATTENVYVQKGSDWATGSLQPQEDGATATLKGTLSGITIAENDVLTLQFPRSGAPDYSGQVGTLADIAAKFDYATASVTVSSISDAGNIIPDAATTTFTNQQAIVKFTLKDKAGGDAPISATRLIVSDGTNSYTVAPASATSEIYVALPGFSGQTVSLAATDGTDIYTYEKTGVTFANGQYYEITVKMTKQAAEGHSLAESAVGEIVGTDGLAYALSYKDNLPTGVTAAGMVAYKSGSNGLVLALADEASSVKWNEANGETTGAAAHTPVVSDHAWRLPSLDEWKQMFKANGGDEGKYSGLNEALASAGGDSSKLQVNEGYWSSTKENEYNAYNAFLRTDGTINFSMLAMNYNSCYVRACLAF